MTYDDGVSRYADRLYGVQPFHPGGRLPSSDTSPAYPSGGPMTIAFLSIPARTIAEMKFKNLCDSREAAILGNLHSEAFTRQAELNALLDDWYDRQRQNERAAA